MARIAGINIPLNKHVVIALTSIYGIGRSSAQKICSEAGISPETAVKDLAEPEVANLRSAVAKYEVEGDLRREISPPCDEPPVRRDDAESKSAQLRTRRLSSLSLARRIVEKAHESKSIS